MYFYSFCLYVSRETLSHFKEFYSILFFAFLGYYKIVSRETMMKIQNRI